MVIYTGDIIIQPENLLLFNGHLIGNSNTDNFWYQHIVALNSADTSLKIY